MGISENRNKNLNIERERERNVQENTLVDWKRAHFTRHLKVSVYYGGAHGKCYAFGYRHSSFSASLLVVQNDCIQEANLI